MTEAEWLACTDPTPMLHFLRATKASDRKLRLFAVACCRGIWPLLTDDRSRRAVEVAEAYADGLARLPALRDAYQAAWAAAKEAIASRDADAGQDLYGMHDDGLAAPAACAAAYAASPDAQQVDSAGYYARHAQLQAASPLPVAERTRRDAEQAALLRDLFGPLPFRDVAVGPSLLTWKDGTLPKLAQAIYDDRQFGDMPVFADGLEEAGCDSPDIVRHCREQGGVHTLGCWVLDLLLQKA
ncbi:MAG TPA: hypothetical protein VG013_13310 [Gemmataceae bacterium]|jgi:hypothetical protein|nr:hypothetical protein [Gemmataceae bacterium]